MSSTLYILIGLLASTSSQRTSVRARFSRPVEGFNTVVSTAKLVIDTTFRVMPLCYLNRIDCFDPLTQDTSDYGCEMYTYVRIRSAPPTGFCSGAYTLEKAFIPLSVVYNAFLTQNTAYSAYRYLHLQSYTVHCYQGCTDDQPPALSIAVGCNNDTFNSLSSKPGQRSTARYIGPDQTIYTGVDEYGLPLDPYSIQNDDFITISYYVGPFFTGLRLVLEFVFNATEPFSKLNPQPSPSPTPTEPIFPFNDGDAQCEMPATQVGTTFYRIPVVDDHCYISFFSCSNATTGAQNSVSDIPVENVNGLGPLKPPLIPPPPWFDVNDQASVIRHIRHEVSNAVKRRSRHHNRTHTTT